MIKQSLSTFNIRERFAGMPRAIKRHTSSAIKKLKQHAKATGAAAVVAGGLLIGGPGAEVAQATPPAFTWEEAPFTINWGAIGLGIGTLIMGALVIWAGIKISIHVFKKFTNRVGSTV